MEGIDYTQLSLVGGITSASFAALNAYLNQSYWKDGRAEFNFEKNVEKFNYMDKLGYFYLANMMTHVFSASLESTNMDYEDTYIYGTLGAALFGSYLEVRDGYSKHTFFSKTDLLSTLIGSGYTLSQYYFPILKEIQPRMSYLPSKRLSEGNNGINENVFNDFLGQKYWLGFRVKNLLPAAIADYWPAFLMLSIGTGISGEDYSNIRSDFYIAFDIDAEEIPLHGSIWQFIKNTLNYFHFPMPGIRLTNGVAVFGFCY